MANTTFSTLRRNGVHSTTFALRLIRSFERLAPSARRHPTAPVFLEHLERIAGHVAATIPDADGPAVDAAVAAARAAFQSSSDEI